MRIITVYCVVNRHTGSRTIYRFEEDAQHIALKAGRDFEVQACNALDEQDCIRSNAVRLLYEPDALRELDHEKIRDDALASLTPLEKSVLGIA